jgi:predicted DNA-binding transcriptional regulator YafY
MLPTDRRRHLRLPIIDRCLQTPGTRWSARQLLALVNQYLAECEKEPVSIRTIQKDLAYLESLPHNPAPLAFTDMGRVRYYYYSDRHYELEAASITTDQAFALEMSAQVLHQLKGFPLVIELEKLRKQLERSAEAISPAAPPILYFENNAQLKGIEWLEPLFEAIRAQTVLKMAYQPYDTSTIEKVIHPWWLRQFNQRWFLFGWDEQYQRLDNSPLDRIVQVSPVSLVYQPNLLIDPAQYFAPIVGVSRFTEDEMQRVKIKVKVQRGHYIRTKPLHASQEELPSANGYCVFQYHIILNKEWHSLLLSFGADLEVLEPNSLRATMQQELAAWANSYQE